MCESTAAKINYTSVKSLCTSPFHKSTASCIYIFTIIQLCFMSRLFTLKNTILELSFKVLSVHLIRIC